MIRCEFMPGHGLYQCGTTALMSFEGWHNDGRTLEEVNRTLAHWKQHLRATGRTHVDDGGLGAFRPRQAPVGVPDCVPLPPSRTPLRSKPKPVKKARR